MPLLSLPDDVLLYIFKYLGFDDILISLSTNKKFRLSLFNRIRKRILDKDMSIKFVMDYEYREQVLTSLHEKNSLNVLCLRFNNLMFGRISPHTPLVRDNFKVVRNLNTLNLMDVYNKHYFFDDLLKISNIKTLLLSCDIDSKSELINNLSLLHTRKITTIIIEGEGGGYANSHETEILMCEKNKITQFFLGNGYDVRKSIIQQINNICQNDICVYTSPENYLKEGVKRLMDRWNSNLEEYYNIDINWDILDEEM